MNVLFGAETAIPLTGENPCRSSRPFRRAGLITAGGNFPDHEDPDGAPAADRDVPERGREKPGWNEPGHEHCANCKQVERTAECWPRLSGRILHSGSGCESFSSSPFSDNRLFAASPEERRRHIKVRKRITSLHVSKLSKHLFTPRIHTDQVNCF